MFCCFDPWPDDLDLSYDDNGETNMYAVPILITNYQDGNTFVNQGQIITYYMNIIRLNKYILQMYPYCHFTSI